MHWVQQRGRASAVQLQVSGPCAATCGARLSHPGKATGSGATPGSATSQSLTVSDSVSFSIKCFGFFFLNGRLRNTAQRKSPAQSVVHGLLPFICPCLPHGSDGEESACNAGHLGSIPGSERSSREGNGYPLPCSCLEESSDRGAWRAIIHVVTKRQTRLSNLHNYYYSVPEGHTLNFLCQEISIFIRNILLL